MFSDFACNICGAQNVTEIVHRELALCAQCGSNARFRAMMAGLSQGLFGKILPMKKLKKDITLRGFGCSDAVVYAERLAELYDYTNTFLHMEPRVDLSVAATLEPFRGCQFILCSDVLEHVLSDPAVAIYNMWDCLAPGGCLVISAPTYTMEATVEKYPTLRDYSVVPIAGRHAIVYETASGALGFDPSPQFHGGPGSVLEMRLFSHAGLMRTIAAAGFRDVSLLGEVALKFGAVWPQAIERNDVPFPMDGRVIVANR